MEKMSQVAAFEPVKWLSEHLNRKHPFVGFKTKNSSEQRHGSWVKVCQYQWSDCITFEGVGPTEGIAKKACALVILAHQFPVTFAENSDLFLEKFGLEPHHVKVCCNLKSLITSKFACDAWLFVDFRKKV
jgi:hypothetical protein